MSEITCPIITAARLFRSNPAIATAETVITYEQLNIIVSKISTRLQKEGILPGQRVAIIAWNHWEYVIVIFALLRIGAVLCPISPRFPAQGIGAILRKIDCAVLMDPQEVLPPHDISPFRIIALSGLFKENEQGMESRSNIPRQKNGRHGEKEVTLDIDRPATIVLTSGTTAVPKAVLHSFGNHYYNALGANENIPIKPGDRWLLSLPLFHVGGLGILFRMVLAGGTIVIPPANEALGTALELYRITHLSVVSTQLHRLLEDGIAPSTSKGLLAVLVGGGPVATSLVQRAQDAGIPLHTTYGLTEMASQVTATAPNDPPEDLLTAGRPLRHRHLKTQDEEILVKGKTLFQGYVEGEKLSRPVDDEGWYHTGDLGRINSAGYLTVTGRRDNMFISGGENICPEEIEKCLCSLPEVSQAMVVPLEDKEFGYRPVVFVKTSAHTSREETKWIAYLEQHLPRFKIPRAFYPWPEEGEQGAMKPDRQAFRKKAAAIGL